MFLSNTYRVQAMIIEANEYIRHRRVIITVYSLNPLTSRPGCMPGSRYTGVRVLFFVI